MTEQTASRQSGPADPARTEPVQTAERAVPVNLRQSGQNDVSLLVGTRVRKSPFWHKSVEHGVRAATVYNRMYHPRLYFSEEEGGLLGEYEYLTRYVTLWNVAVERQIRVKGPDALAFVDRVVTRRMTGDDELKPGKARYVVLCDQDGGIVNDPVLLRLADDEFWFSISDSDVLLWFKGLNQGFGYDVAIEEIDVSPVQIQGPLARELMRDLAGEAIDALKFYNLMETEIAGCPVVVSRTGFSAEIGYEIYLRDATYHADALWDAIVEAGRPYHLKVVAPGHIRRIEAGILSYGQDMDQETNPYEVGLGWQVHLDKPDFIGRDALARIANDGPKRKLAGLTFTGRPITWYNADFWIVRDADADAPIGYVTSAFWSPKLGCNIALAMLPVDRAEEGQALTLDRPGEPEPVVAQVAPVPFYDPERTLSKAA